MPALSSGAGRPSGAGGKPERSSTREAPPEIPASEATRERKSSRGSDGSRAGRFFLVGNRGGGGGGGRGGAGRGGAGRGGG